jgi:hypothetical protein
MASRYGNERLDAACHRALGVRARSYKHVANILKHGLDQVVDQPAPAPTRSTHDNVRGSDYYN